MARTDRLWTTAGVLWVAAIAGIQIAVWRFEGSGGPIVPASRIRPDAGATSTGGGRPRLFMFVRGDCPCSVASVREFGRLVESIPDAKRPLIEIHFIGSDDDDRGLLWDLAGAIPGARRVRDADDAVARRFGATTSGQILAYDSTDTLMFQGGLTVARGHEGESPGRSVLREWLRNGTPVPPRVAALPAFGCDLIATGGGDPS